MPHRVLLIAAWVRILSRGEHRDLQISALDKAFMLLSACLILTETLQTGGAGFAFGVANNVLDALGTYFLCRIFFQSAEDLKHILICLAAICVLVAAFMSLEFLTGRNWLAPLGAMQDMVVSRLGRRRCGASFGVPITAGTFGAVLLPLFIACWWQGDKMKKWAIPGCVASTVITLTAGSASPLTAYAAGIGALLVWPLRGHMRRIRWAALFSLLALHIVMKAPVWALIARIQVVPGASAWHRYNILDNFIRNIGEWWLYGIKSTEHWGWEADDLANQYCVIAKHGGLLAVIIFVYVLALAFREVGRTVTQVDQDKPTALLAWSFGAMLFANVTAFIGIAYVDQTKIVWYASLAMLASLKVLVPEQNAELSESARQASPLSGRFEDGVPEATRL
jgi:hypothetical protein